VLKPETVATWITSNKVTKNVAPGETLCRNLQGRSSHVKDRVEEGRKLLEVIQRAEARHDGDGDEVEEDDEERDAVHRGLADKLLPPADAQVLPDDVTRLRGELGLPRLGLAGVRRLQRMWVVQMFLGSVNSCTDRRRPCMIIFPISQTQELHGW
jgi:hypothetical protein